MPSAKPEIFLLVPLPAIEPGLIVQLPEGNPVKITLPVATVQVGCVMAPAVGLAGVSGCKSIVLSAEAGEVHPTVLVTEYE